MSELDFGRISALLGVIEGCAGHPGRFPAIINAATAELSAINEQVRQEAIAARKAEAAAKAQETTTDDEEAEASEESPKAIPSVTINNGRRL